MLIKIFIAALIIILSIVIYLIYWLLKPDKVQKEEGIKNKKEITQEEIDAFYNYIKKYRYEYILVLMGLKPNELDQSGKSYVKDEVIIMELNFKRDNDENLSIKFYKCNQFKVNYKNNEVLVKGSKKDSLKEVLINIGYIKVE